MNSFDTLGLSCVSSCMLYLDPIGNIILNKTEYNSSINQGPLVSIGMPIFNGEKFIDESIKSILCQTYPHFELIIFDNASTDRTQLICSKYCELDNRVRYHRHSCNKGAAWNFNSVFKASTGKYFKWTAADDILKPTYLEQCLLNLEQHHNLILCTSRALDIDDQGQPIREVSTQKENGHADPSIRFTSNINLKHFCTDVFGVIRKDILEATSLIGNYPDSDRVLLAELALHGEFYEVSELLWVHRVHPNNSVSQYPDRIDRYKWFDPSHHHFHLPYWREVTEFYKIVKRSSLTIKMKKDCYTAIVRWILQNHRALRSDLTHFSKSILKYLLRRKKL